MEQLTRTHFLFAFAGLMLGFAIAIEANTRPTAQQQPDSYTQEASRFTN